MNSKLRDAIDRYVRYLQGYLSGNAEVEETQNANGVDVLNVRYAGRKSQYSLEFIEEGLHDEDLRNMNGIKKKAAITASGLLEAPIEEFAPDVYDETVNQGVMVDEFLKSTGHEYKAPTAEQHRATLEKAYEDSKGVLEVTTSDAAPEKRKPGRPKGSGKKKE